MKTYLIFFFKKKKKDIITLVWGSFKKFYIGDVATKPNFYKIIEILIITIGMLGAFFIVTSILV